MFFKKKIIHFLGGFSFFVLPLIFSFFNLNKKFPVFATLAFILLALLFVYYRFWKRQVVALELEIGNMYNSIKLLQAELSQSERIACVITSKKSRYYELETMVNKIGYNLSLNGVARYIVRKTFELNPKSDTCCLYIVDTDKQCLEIVDYVTANDVRYTPSPSGDVLDNWMLKHVVPLRIDDIEQDYRFEKEQVRDVPFGSVLAAPLLIDEKIIGLIRLNSREKYKFYSEDIDFLSTIADLASVAISNAVYYKKLENFAVHDGLTGLYLRRYLMERLDDVLLYGRQQRFSLVMLDIDDFKLYNDRFGHTAGDIVLKNVAAIINKNIRKHKDIPVRFGGEEFLIYLEGRDKKAAIEIAETIRKEIQAREVILRRMPTSVTVSIGVSSYPQDGTDRDTLIKAADENLYLAKQTGKNRVCFGKS